MRRILLSLGVAVAAMSVSAPASAQAWRLQPSVQRQIQNDINQLDRQISRAAARRTISQREATGLRREALNLQRQYNRYVRRGLNRQEVAYLETGVNRLHPRLRLERRD